MTHKNLSHLLELWEKEPAFRANMRRDAITTLKELGLTLEAGEMETLKKIDWQLSDEELQKRASKFLA